MLAGQSLGIGEFVIALGAECLADFRPVRIIVKLSDKGSPGESGGILGHLRENDFCGDARTGCLRADRVSIEGNRFAAEVACCFIRRGQVHVASAITAFRRHRRVRLVT